MLGVLNGARLLMAVASVFAIYLQADYLSSKGRFELGGFLSFFTIQANLIAVAVLVIEGLGGCGFSQRWRAAMRGAVVLYLSITGLVYAVLLSQLPIVKEIVHPVSDGVHHLLIPLWVVFDWVADPPGERPSYRRSLSWLAYPLAFLFVSLIRGAWTGWYPYPFLDPRQRGGWIGVAMVSIFILLVSCVMIWGIVRMAPKTSEKS